MKVANINIYSLLVACTIESISDKIHVYAISELWKGVDFFQYKRIIYV